MWHTTELIGAFKDITNRYGYGIYQNRKLSVAVCNDLLAEYDTEKNIVQMLFQAGLGETFIGVASGIAQRKRNDARAIGRTARCIKPIRVTLGKGN